MAEELNENVVDLVKLNLQKVKLQQELSLFQLSKDELKIKNMN